MEESNVEKLTKEIMADSRLVALKPDMENEIMERISVDYITRSRRRELRTYILLFVGIETVLTGFVWTLFNYFPGLNNEVVYLVKNFILAAHKAGELTIQSLYLIISFIVVLSLKQILDLSERLSYKKV
jgi:hypothetical protein